MGNNWIIIGAHLNSWTNIVAVFRDTTFMVMASSIMLRWATRWLLLREVLDFGILLCCGRLGCVGVGQGYWVALRVLLRSYL